MRNNIHYTFIIRSMDDFVVSLHSLTDERISGRTQVALLRKHDVGAINQSAVSRVKLCPHLLYRSLKKIPPKHHWKSTNRDPGRLAPQPLSAGGGGEKNTFNCQWPRTRKTQTMGKLNKIRLTFGWAIRKWEKALWFYLKRKQRCDHKKVENCAGQCWGGGKSENLVSGLCLFKWVTTKQNRKRPPRTQAIKYDGSETLQVHKGGLTAGLNTGGDIATNLLLNSKWPESCFKSEGGNAKSYRKMKQCAENLMVRGKRGPHNFKSTC